MCTGGTIWILSPGHFTCSSVLPLGHSSKKQTHWDPEARPNNQNFRGSFPILFNHRSFQSPAFFCWGSDGFLERSGSLERTEMDMPLEYRFVSKLGDATLGWKCPLENSNLGSQGPALPQADRASHGARLALAGPSCAIAPRPEREHELRSFRWAQNELKVAPSKKVRILLKCQYAFNGLNIGSNISAKGVPVSPAIRVLRIFGHFGFLAGLIVVHLIH